MTALLAPAGNLEKLKVAVAYGADEVYFGLERFSLRAFAGNFSLDDAQTGLRHLHAHNKKGFAALNIYPFEEEYAALLDTAAALADMGVDALIVSDLGVLKAIREAGIRVPIHISTQANTLSLQAVRAWQELGAQRINLARELSFDRIAQITAAAREVEIEVFIHGAVCFSYSGRCAISDWLTGRRANRGECTHPCRWEYAITEKKRPGETFSVAEDERGLYLFNSRDLALFSFALPLMKAGVHAFKIEGRMKSTHYLAVVVSLYRRLMDGAQLDETEALAELSRLRNRGFSTGFMKGTVTPEDYRFDSSETAGISRFLGIVLPSPEGPIIDVRNRMRGGDKVEILVPRGPSFTAQLPDPLLRTDGETTKEVHHGRQLVLPFDLPVFSIVRSRV